MTLLGYTGVFERVGIRLVSLGGQQRRVILGERTEGGFMDHIKHVIALEDDNRDDVFRRAHGNRDLGNIVLEDINILASRTFKRPTRLPRPPPVEKEEAENEGENEKSSDKTLEEVKEDNRIEIPETKSPLNLTAEDTCGGLTFENLDQLSQTPVKDEKLPSDASKGQVSSLQPLEDAAEMPKVSIDTAESKPAALIIENVESHDQVKPSSLEGDGVREILEESVGDEKEQKKPTGGEEVSSIVAELNCL